MSLTTDTRGVSEVVGAILLFGLLVAVLAILQTQAIPTANEEIEFNHNQEVQNDLIEFQEAASRTAAHGTTESVGIRAGTTYPSRLLFFNPPNPAGTVRTVEDGEVTIENVEATDDIIRDAHIDGEIDELETSRIEYEPIYNEYQNPPMTALEYGILYNSFPDAQVVENTGAVVSGNNINLMFYTGDVSQATSGSITLDTIPASAPSRTVTVEPTDDIEITVPSNLDATEWEETVFEDEDDVTASDSGDNIVIEVDEDAHENFELRMSQVGVGSAVASADAEYIYPTETGSEITVDEDETVEIPIEVRDRYNNPVSGVELGYEADQGTADGPSATDADGQAIVTYEASDEDDTITIDAPDAGAVDEFDIGVTVN